MGEESKYYTPKITEFYIGFDYEFLFKNHPTSPDGWNKGFFIAEHSLKKFKELIDNGFIRVKHLDRSDIESEGWKYDNNAEPIYARKEGYDPCMGFMIEKYVNSENPNSGLHQWTLYWWEDGEVWIDFCISPAYEGYLFKGTVLNKSELQRVLKMVGA